MDNAFIGAFIAFFVAFFSIPLIIKIAVIKKLFDAPGARKVHKKITPTLGGIAVFNGFILAYLTCTPLSPELKYIAAATCIMFFLGVKDDLVDLSPSKKLVGQIVAAFLVMQFGGIIITNLHGFLGIYELPTIISVFLTLFTIIVTTNAINLIDGIDGLAGSLTFLFTAIVGTFFLINHNISFAVLAFSLSAAILGFLVYNFAPAKIFMGDTGSLVIGLLCSVLVIKFMAEANNPLNVLRLPNASAIGFALLIVPLFDTLRVFTLRILERKSPFSPDRRHLHHYLLDIGFNHAQIAITLAASSLFFVALAYLLRTANPTVSVAILLATAGLLSFVVYRLKEKNKQRSAQKVANEVLETLMLSKASTVSSPSLTKQNVTKPNLSETDNLSAINKN